jgi:hypothetical protein
MSDDPRDPGNEGEGSSQGQGGGGDGGGLKLKSERLDEIIWRIFTEDLGGCARPRDVANALLDSEVLDAQEIHNLARRALTERVRTVLRQHDKRDLPMSGPLPTAEGEEDAPWQQRPLGRRNHQPTWGPAREACSRTTQ